MAARVEFSPNPLPLVDVYWLLRQWRHRIEQEEPAPVPKVRRAAWLRNHSRCSLWLRLVTDTLRHQHAEEAP